MFALLLCIVVLSGTFYVFWGAINLNFRPQIFFAFFCIFFCKFVDEEKKGLNEWMTDP
jgi:hypothetical protein